MPAEPDFEISDLVVRFDPQTLKRQRVRHAPVLDYYLSRNNRAAARVIRKLGKDGEYFDNNAVDEVLLLAHMELQRLEEEFLHGHRVLDLVRAAVFACEAGGVPPPYRVVDVGCGLGYVVRWLTSFGGLGADVELVGVDYNTRFVAAAKVLAEQEGLRCRFEVANAFELAEPATVFISSGVLHHFRGTELDHFFRAQAKETTTAFVHTDIVPSPLSPIGAWGYHRARMRQALARHDGTLSAKRAHSAETLIAAAENACPNLAVHLHDQGTLPLLNVFQSLVGIRPDLEATFLQALKRRHLELSR